MKFQDIMEANISKEPYVIEMYHNIYQNCQPYLQEAKPQESEHTFMRGLKYLEADPGEHALELGIKTARLGNRKPLDMAQIDHDSLNEYFTEHYGHPYRNGIFVSGDGNTVENYGNVFAIFPIGKFDYIWHPEINDLYTEVGDPEFGVATANFFDYMKSKGIDKEEFDSEQAQYNAADLLDFLISNRGPYKSANLITALHTARVEIMLWVEKYYYLDTDYLNGFYDWLSK